MIAVYVTGHGYGHATRTAEVLRAIRARDPRVPITITTTAPAFLFDDVPGGVEVRARASDVGLAQAGALVIDEPGTLARWRAFAAGANARRDEEAAWLRAAGARVVVGDIPPLAFDAAAEAGVAGIAIGNFSWDWIYRHLAQRRPGFMAPARAAATSYGRADGILALPFAGDLSAFARREDVPLLARRPRLARDEARRRLGLSLEATVVLVSFGGLGLPGFHPRVLASMSDVTFLVESKEPLPRNARDVRPPALQAAGIAYPEVVAAADVVLTKPGYGIVSDAIAAGARLLYTDRGDFPEYAVMVREMPEWLPAAYVSREDVFAGRFDAPLRGLLAMPWPERRPLNGAEEIAERVLARS